MKLRYLLLAIASLALASCAGKDKYPYAPQFASPEQVPSTVLAAPPAVGSPAFNHGINTVLRAQKKLTPAHIAVLQAEDKIRPAMLVNPVLGDSITPEAFPKLYDHLKHTGSDAWRISDAVEDYYNSPRPWIADTRVKLYVGTITRPGYPSGHTTTNSVWAYVLGDLLPCKQPALLARASAIGYHRMEAGAHFPFDVEGGKQLAKYIYDTMTLSSDYRMEHEAVRQELAAAKVGCPVAQ